MQGLGLYEIQVYCGNVSMIYCLCIFKLYLNLGKPLYLIVVKRHQYCCSSISYDSHVFSYTYY